MNTFTGLLTGIACLIASLSAVAQNGPDTDDDGVSDTVEEALLARLSPVIYGGEANQTTPIPIDWFVRHCRLRWYEAPFTGLNHIGASFGETPSIDRYLQIMAEHRNIGHRWHYRLRFLSDSYRFGNDPADPMSWDRCQQEQRGMYGRVVSLGGPGARYRVQYFVFFGWNETDTPPDCDYGNHEGDWICVQFDVEASNLDMPRIFDCVYHNHGRQIFVQSPSALEFEGTHPVMHLERGTQEPWPYRSSEGFRLESTPPCVTTNEILTADIFTVPCQIEWTTACNRGYLGVRQHNGEGPRLLVTNIVNVGEHGKPYPHPESRFFQSFSPAPDQGYEWGPWWGDDYYGCCYEVFCGPEVTSPRGPAYQPEMWDAGFNRDFVRPNYDDQVITHVNFGYVGIQDGSLARPFRSLTNALAVISPGGTIVLSPGSSPERLTITESCTVQSSGGPVTIGQ